MTDREKLIELIKGITTNCHEIECEKCRYDNMPLWNCQDYLLADYLIANGVVIREKGEWEEIDDMYFDDVIYRCDVCKEDFVTISGTPADNLWNFCPNCGADMRGE